MLLITEFYHRNNKPKTASHWRVVKVVRPENKIKYIYIKKEIISPFLLEDDIILYIGNLKEYSKSYKN